MSLFFWNEQLLAVSIRLTNVEASITVL